MNAERAMIALVTSIIGSACCCGNSHLATSTTTQPNERSDRQQSRKVDPHIAAMNAEEPFMERRNKKILSEIEQLGEHEWAGVYAFGDGMGCNVTFSLAPRGGFTYTWYGCLGLYDLNHGDVIEVNENMIRLRFALDPSKILHDAIGAQLFRVRWGRRHYLVPRSRMIEFCNDVNSGIEPGFERLGRYDRSLKHLIRERELTFPVEGLPDVPSEYVKYLLPQPVSVEITRILEKKTAPNRRDLYKVEVNAGSNKGLIKGMRLRTTRGNDHFWGATVITADPQTAIVELGDYDKDSTSAPEIGDQLCSRHWLYEPESVGSHIGSDQILTPKEAMAN